MFFFITQHKIWLLPQLPPKKKRKKKKGASHDCHSRNMIEVDLVMEKYPPIKQKPLNNFIRKLGM